MTQHTESIVIEPVTDLSNFATSENDETVNTAKPEAMAYKV
jgi:hypothetical protein